MRCKRKRKTSKWTCGNHATESIIKVQRNFNYYGPYGGGTPTPNPTFTRALMLRPCPEIGVR